jgi:hypothetical protein
MVKLFKQKIQQIRVLSEQFKKEQNKIWIKQLKLQGKHFRKGLGQK